MRANCFWPKTLPFNFCLSRAKLEGKGSVEERERERGKSAEEREETKRKRGKRGEFLSETLQII